MLASPLRRAVATAELTGLTGAVTDTDLYEWDYGGYEGVTTEEIRRSTPDWSLWTHGVPPGDAAHPGESAAEVGRPRGPRPGPRRPGAARRRRRRGMVAHGHFLRVLTARYLGLDPADGRLFLLRTGTVGVLSTEHGLPVIAGWNIRP